MQIAKIIKSNSHVDYVARIFDTLETAAPPAVSDYRFGQFVSIKNGDREVIGVIYNSQLLNPDYGNYGPRLATPSEHNAVFSPDYLNEQGVLIGLLLVGWHDAQGYRQGLPREVLPVNAAVETLDDEQLRTFHHPKGALELSYYPHVTTHAGFFAFALLNEIADQLERLTDKQNQARLQVLRKSLQWQQTMSTMR
ncbi:MAG: hypothetical protein HOP19_22155 [Acidobacteria bacterium]|nr:hypothetical protein [Acidobacteriota bacterium]